MSSNLVPKVGILVPADLPRGIPQGGELGFLSNLLPHFPLPVVVFGVAFYRREEGKESGSVDQAEFRAVGSSPHPSGLPVRLKCLYWYLRKRREILGSGVDVLYVQQLEVALPFLFGSRRLPVVFHQHDVHNPATISRYGWGRAFVFRWFFDLVLWLVRLRADWNIVVDDECLREARSSAAGERVTLVRNCVDSGKFCVLEAARSRRRAELGLEAGEFVVLVCGRLEEVKRIDRAVRALSLLTNAGVLCRLVIAGEGSCRDELEILVRDLGLESRVCFLGAVAHGEMPAVYNMADFLLMPSRGEGAPLAVLEALSCGTPVVANSVGAIPRIVRDGKNGFLLMDATPTEIAETLRRCFERRWSRLAVADTVKEWDGASVGMHVAQLLVAVCQGNASTACGQNASSNIARSQLGGGTCL
jgi:glycosyltransferase involved in cell wall biosynthesis